MMKKYNKVILLTLLSVFLLGIVGAAEATTFSDVTGTDVQSSAIYKLNSLGIIEGYPDGTFGTEKSITRAEFAKIAVSTAGLQTIASGMNNVPSAFSDVSSDFWANGWINVAAAQGFVKGDPSGTFRPDDLITQAEVITVLMRILGYNDNLAGNWPADYIANASNLGVLDDVTFTANKAGTRGEVAVLCSATLDENIVEYKSSDNLFSDMLPVKTLLADRFDNSVKTEDALFAGMTIDDYDEFTMNYYTYDADGVISTVKTKKVAGNCTFSGAADIFGATGHFVDFIENDDHKIINIAVKNYKVIGPLLANGTMLSEIEIKNGKVKADGTEYSFVNTNVVTEAFEGAPGMLTAAPGIIPVQKYDSKDFYFVVLNKDDKVAEIAAFSMLTPGIVKEVKDDRIIWMDNAAPEKHILGKGVMNSNDSPFDGFDNESNYKDKHIYVTRNGLPAKLTDIQPLDLVNILKGNKGCDYFIFAVNTTIPGKLEKAEYSGNDIKSVTVSGMKINVSYTNLFQTNYSAYYSLDNGETFEGAIQKDTLDSEYDLWGRDLTVRLNASGTVGALIFGDTSESSKNYGVITDWSGDITASTGDAVQNVTIMKADGEEYTYGLATDSYLQNAATGTRAKVEELAAGGRAADYAAAQALLVPTAGAASFNSGILVSVSLDSDNLIKTIKYWAAGATAVAAANMDADEDLFKAANGVWYDAADVVVFNLVGTDLDDTTVLGWKELKESAGANYYAYYTNSSNELEYVVIPTTTAAALASDTKYAIYQEQYSDSDDWIKFVGMDAFEVDAIVAGLTKGDVVSYKLSGGKATAVTKVLGYNVTTNASTIDTLNKGTLVLANGTSYKIDSEDTVYLDNSDDKNLQVLEGVAEGDTVIIVDNTKKLSGAGAPYGDTAMAIIVVD